MRNATKRNITLPVGTEVKTEAVQTIINQMGITRAALFIRENLSQQIDYIHLKTQLFRAASAADVYAAIKAKS